MKDYGLLTMEVTPTVEMKLKEAFNLEVEILQGDREIMPDGRNKITIKIYDATKCEMVKEFCLKMISQSHNQIGN